MAILVSFDVDGTLIRSRGEQANHLHREAFSAAFKQVFGLDTTIDVIPHHGSTDTLILVAVLELHGIPKDKVRGRARPVAPPAPPDIPPPVDLHRWVCSAALGLLGAGNLGGPLAAKRALCSRALGAHGHGPGQFAPIHRAPPACRPWLRCRSCKKS